LASHTGLLSRILERLEALGARIEKWTPPDDCGER
jgi:hypothetical protein